MKEIRIDNSKQSAVKSGKWKNPGSSFYYKILNSFTIADPKRSEEDPDRYDFDFRKTLQEAYLVAPVEKIKNSPYGITPYSQSGCKYPHHVIRNGKLVVSIPGIQAAYARAKQQGIYKGKVKEHIDRHYKEMGLTMSTMTESVDPIQDQIDLNFDFIQKYIESALGVKFVHDDVMMESVDDIVDKEQYIKETFDWMDEILYESDEEYNESITDEMMLSHIDESIQKMNDFIDDAICREVEIENIIIGTAPCTRIDFTSQKTMFESAERCLFGEKSHGSLRYDYRVGIDVDAARLVAVKFKLIPELVTAAGNIDDMNAAIRTQRLNPSVEKQLMLLRNQLKKARNSGNLAAVQLYTNAIQDLINVFARRNLKSAGVALQKVIRKEGHIDHVTNASTVDSIFHPDGSNMNSVRMIGSLSTPIRDFQRHIVAKYGIDRLKPFMVTTTRSFANDSTIKWTFSLVALFEKCNTADNTFIRNEFKRFIKSYASHFETYKVGTPGGGDKYKSTKLVWDMNRFQQTMSIAPKFRGSFPKPSTPDREIDVVNTYDHYNGLNAPRFAEVPKRKIDDMIHEDGPWIDDDTEYALKYFENMERIFNDAIQAIDEFLERKGIHWEDESISDDETIFNLDIPDINTDSYDEKSHSKLKYDFRLAWDYDTGHQIKIVYGLDNINITDVGDFAILDSPYSKDDYLSHARNTIRTKGNLDHQSKGQTVLAIIDMVTGRRLQKCKAVAPFSRYLVPTQRAQGNLRQFQKGASENPAQNIAELEVGKVDNHASYKSTHWFTRDTTDPETGKDLRFRQIVKAEIYPSGRGHKLNNLMAKDFKVFGHEGEYNLFINPNKKQALEELRLRKLDCQNYIKHLLNCIKTNQFPSGYTARKIQALLFRYKRQLDDINNDLATIARDGYDVSIMKKYHESNDIDDMLFFVDPSYNRQAAWDAIRSFNEAREQSENNEGQSKETTDDAPLNIELGDEELEPAEEPSEEPVEEEELSEEEIDFEEKYSAIDATGSDWNEFWSLFERGELHKTKSQMINYYNQYLEYIESIGNSSSDEIANVHQYKEKIDEMQSDPEYDSWMRRMDLDDMLYAEHRLSQLKPISDEEFIKELLENKAGMLALTDPDDTELIERYQNEIAYLIDCKLNPSVALDKDAINWEYMNLIQYGMNEAVNVDALRRQVSNFIENYCSTKIIHCQDIALPYLLKSYTLYERTSTIPDVKYSYRMGIDVDTGKLVAIKFKLEPDKITKVGNAAGHLDAYLSKHPEERRQYEQLNQKLNQLKQAGDSDAAKKIERQLKEFEAKVEANANNHKFLNKDGKVTTLVDTLKNVITRTGHIDFVSGDNEIVGIIYRDGKAYTMKNGKGKKVRILPAQSEQVGEFLGRMRNYDPALMQKFTMRNPSNYIPRNQDDGQVISLTAAFADPKVQNLFISFVKQFRYQPEVYEIGKTCGPNKYQSTRVLWDNLLLYRKLGDTPQFRGPILDLEVKSINRFNPKTQKYEINYTGLGSPEFIKKESYESGNLNTIITDIKNNIKKYEETVQNINTHTGECNNEFITVNPNDGMELRENTWNHFMKLINDSENKFGLARSNNHHLDLVESIDEDTDFSDENIISLIEEYASFVERNSSLKHEYRMGVDTNNGRLVAIEFDLDPNRIVKVGNQVAFNNANSYAADPINHFLAFLQNKRDSAKTEKERDGWNRQITDVENKVYQRKSDEVLDELKKTIKRTGHIDYVSKGGKVTNIFYYDGTGSGKHTKGPITMIPVLSPELNGFIRYLDSMNPAYLAYQKNPEQGYNILNDRFIKHRQTNPSNYNDKNKYIYSLTSLFTDSEIQKLFVKYVKDHHINGETYQVGESYSKDERFKTTKILWDALWMYRKFTYHPVFRGTIPTYDLENNRKNAPRYTGLNKPREAKKKKPIKESNTELLDSIYEALYPLDPRSYEAMNSLLYDEYLEALELHEIDVSAILNSKLPEDINLISEITSNIDWLISNKSNQFNMDLSSYLEADDQSEEKDPVEDGDTPPNIDLGDEEITSDEPPTTDTEEPESTEEDTPSEDETKEDPKEDTSNEAPSIIEPTSLPKAADAQETDKNGVNRKKLYIAFIEWAKSYNARNTFGSLFDKDVFDVTYPFVPHEMRYFYRLANPILCVLSGKLTFFQVSELRKLNADNPDMKDALIFAATENDYRAFSTRDKRVYLAVDKPDGSGIQFTRALADSFDLYLQNMIGKGDILHGDVDSSTDSGTDRGDHSDENGE